MPGQTVQMKYEIDIDEIFNGVSKEIEVTVNPQIVNNVVGYKRENIDKIKEMYDIDVVVKQDPKLSPTKINVKASKKYKEFIDDNENIK